MVKNKKTNTILESKNYAPANITRSTKRITNNSGFMPRASASDEMQSQVRSFFKDDLANIAESVFTEGTVASSKADTKETKKYPDPNKTKNKIGKGLIDFSKPCTLCCDEDEEVPATITIEDEVISLFDSMPAMTSGLSVSNILAKLQKTESIFEKNKIMYAIQELINSGRLREDSSTGKIHLVTEEAEEVPEVNLDQFIKDSSLSDKIIEYFDNSITGSVAGVSISEAVKDIKKETGAKKPEIMSCITKLLKNKKLKKGVTPGTIIINSAEEEEESLIQVPTSDTSTQTDNKDMPLTNQETPESLKLKGWKEENPNIFVSPDGNVKYILSKEGNSLNIYMNYKDKEWEQLCEEFDAKLDAIESGAMDNTDGLDEFESETDEFETDEDVDFEDEDSDEMVTVQLTKQEADTLRTILDKIEGVEEVEIDDDDKDAAEDDDFIDDAATDEEANAKLLDADLEKEEDNEEEFKDIEWDFDDLDTDEDEEELADAIDSVYDGSFSDGAPTFKKHTPAYDSKGKPIASKEHAPTAHGSAHDCTERKGGATMQKHTAAYDKSGKPIKSKVTSGVKKSIFAL